MNYSERLIEVSDIYLDEANPRFPPVNSQREAIQVMLNDQGEKIVNLASDIYQNGLNPSSKLILFKEGGKFVDGDGNRRVTALKILETPALADSEPRIRKKIGALLKKSGSVPSKVGCVIFKSRGSARHWISINHSGLQEGRGQIAWDAEQKNRFEGKHTIGLEALDLLSHRKLITADDKAKINKTTLDRLLSYKGVKSKLSIGKKGSRFSFKNVTHLKETVLALRNKKVDEVYTAHKGVAFVSSVLTASSTVSPGQSNGQPGDQADSRTRRKSNPGLMVFGGALSLKHGHVNNLYRDIETLFEAFRSGKLSFSDDFIVIVRMSLRMLAETAAREVNKDLKAYLTDNFDQAKSTLDQNQKTSLSSQSVEKGRIVQLFQTGAHDYSSSRNREQAIALSIILGAILSITHKKTP